MGKRDHDNKANGRQLEAQQVWKMTVSRAGCSKGEVFYETTQHVSPDQWISVHNVVPKERDLSQGSKHRI